jgi:hypothetical protein
MHYKSRGNVYVLPGALTRHYCGLLLKTTVGVFLTMFLIVLMMMMIMMMTTTTTMVMLLFIYSFIYALIYSRIPAHRKICCHVTFIIV